MLKPETLREPLRLLMPLRAARYAVAMSNPTKFEAGKKVTIVLPDAEVPAQFVTLQGGGQGLEIEGVLFGFETQEIPCGLRTLGDDASADKLNDLRQRGKVTTQADPMPVELRE